MPTDVLPAKISRILVAVDGSDHAERAAMTAADLARKYSALLEILHVASYPRNMLGIGSAHTVSVGIPMTDSDIDREKKNAIDSMKRIEAFASRLGIAPKMEIVESSGSISDRIIDYAYRENINLIIAGDLGLNQYQSSLMGSVSTGILSKARCSVMIVR